MIKVTLYDLPSKDPCRTWSLNPWKTRLILNYKEIEYDTEWTEYPDVAPKFKALWVSLDLSFLVRLTNITAVAWNQIPMETRHTQSQLSVL